MFKIVYLRHTLDLTLLPILSLHLELVPAKTNIAGQNYKIRPFWSYHSATVHRHPHPKNYLKTFCSHPFPGCVKSNKSAEILAKIQQRVICFENTVITHFMTIWGLKGSFILDKNLHYCVSKKCLKKLL